jgi:hypothetical protein
MSTLALVLAGLVAFAAILAGMAFMAKAFISDKLSDMSIGVILVIIGIAIFLVTS